MKQIIRIFILFIISTTVALAQSTRFESGVEQVPLIELYTSEGCSSCPPADRWLSKLRSEDTLWNGFVPIAFHVDYWNYIGWIDPFANKEYSKRQRRYAAEFSESTVYTPGIRKAGEEWRRWRFFGSPEASQPLTVGNIILDVADDRSFKASFAPQVSNNNPKQLTVALLGLDLSSEVTRGENHGKTLNHDFVVLGLSTFASAKQGQWTGELPEAKTQAPAYAVAAWVTEGGSLKPIQAVGGYLN